MAQSTGIIETVTGGGTAGTIKEDTTLETYEFTNPRHIPNVLKNEHFEFIKIIQNTPQGERVIATLTKRLP